MKGQIYLDDLDTFLEKSKEGSNHVYQLHRQLGVVHIDASFQDATYPGLLYNIRIDVGAPAQKYNDVQWDDYNFPYEIETYEGDDEVITVPLYRTRLESIISFTNDIAIAINQGDVELPEELSTEFEVIITAVDNICDIVKNLGDKRNIKRDNVIITISSGAMSLDEDFDFDQNDILGGYLCSLITRRRDLYEKVSERADTKRRKALEKFIENRIKVYTELLNKHNFKQGFVSR